MTDWSRVERVVYRVRQHYRYTYSGPVWDLRQRLLMLPRDRFGDQRLIAHRLDVRGTEGDHALSWERDGWGNRVARILARRVPRAVDFEATFRVERVAAESDLPRPAPWKAARGPRDYLTPTALTAPDDRLRAAAGEISRLASDRRER
ncbi:MAG: transglutaminase N-terminal domain-containing protein, partial [Candidatus Limnocylindria bacterium]